MSIWILALLALGCVGWDNDRREQSDSSLRYNPFEQSWSYEREDESLTYNPMEQEWSYEPDDSSLRYNPFEKRWEYAE